MHDDDLTVADEDAMAALRRIAAEAKQQPAADDATIVGDAATAEEIRRIAAQARASAPATDDEPGDAGGDTTGVEAVDEATVVGDNDTMAEIMRIAAEAREAAVATDDGATVVADGDAAEEIRRIAEQARQDAASSTNGAASTSSSPRDAADDQTIVGDAEVLEQIRAMAADARRSPEVDLPPPVVQPVAAAPPRIERVEILDPRSAPPPTGRPIDHAAPPARGEGSSWQPPDRMVMPDAPAKHADEPSAGPWKAVALVVTAALLVLILLLAFGVVGGSGDSPAGDQTDTDQPAEDTEGGADDE